MHPMTRSKFSLRPRLTLMVLALTLPLAAQAAAPAITAQIGPNFQYGSAAFAEVVQTSYKVAGQQGSFDDWISAAYLKAGVPLGDSAGSLSEALDARAAAVRAASGEARIKLERGTATWAHTFIKKAIPKFSLERGFELANVVRTGERQCLAQSFIISALLQRAGMQAGAVMVWANPEGKQSNLGHVVSVVRLSGGNDLLVDASDPTPFMRHQGLLVKTGERYTFVKPIYSQGDSISGYMAADSGTQLSVKATAPLTLSYLHSQFDYYRGERAIGGFMGTGVGKATPDGLKQSALYLKRAVQEDPQNALATFVLGHVLKRQGQLDLAKLQYQKASALYTAQGHTPGGVQTALDALSKAAVPGKS